MKNVDTRSHCAEDIKKFLKAGYNIVEFCYFTNSYFVL